MQWSLSLQSTYSIEQVALKHHELFNFISI